MSGREDVPARRGAGVVSGARLPSSGPAWYQDAVIYQLHVRAFSDSNADGIGDFRGLVERLDYLQDLGVTALWLLPFYPSPLKDDGYDIADYTAVHPAYGTLHDFKVFLREARRRGLRVITELVLNHTSDRLAWFEAARRAPPGSRARDMYVWSDSPDRYAEARVIFKDFETSNWAWDPVAKAYYWHRFYAHQPDLNYDNPAVRKAMSEVLEFWLGLGVDGLRLDAVPYLYEREGTSCENLPETHAYLKELRRQVDEKFQDRMLLAEANQWPEDAVAYFGDGDECHMAFHFPLMPRLFMAIRQEDRFPILDILEQTPRIPPGCQWAAFLRNHDELTLEMVTDEERDYMYKVYAREPQARINLGIRRRLAPLLGNDRRKIELMNGLLFSLIGTPVIYYGDEIGMGDNIYLGDRNGVRTPLQWSPDRNAGFSRANPQQLYLPVIIDPEYHYESVNIEAQRRSPQSLLWWMKHIISLRKRHRAFAVGELEFLHPENRKVLAFVRRHEGQAILAVANLSRFTEYVELDLAGFRGGRPVELFGRVEFPPVGDRPYVLTLGPHGFYWFDLGAEARKERFELRVPQPATIEVSPGESWEEALAKELDPAAEAALIERLQASRWFMGKARRVAAVTVEDIVRVRNGDVAAAFLFLAVAYVEGDPELYVLPVVPGEAAGGDPALPPLFRLQDATGNTTGVLADATADPRFQALLFDAMARRRRWKGASSEVVGALEKDGRAAAVEGGPPPATAARNEQSNTSIVYGERSILKLFRRLEPGVNPDLEMGRCLREHGFHNLARVQGSLEWRRREETYTLGILSEFVPGASDGWSHALEALGRYFERALARGDGAAPPAPVPLLDGPDPGLSAADLDTLGTYPSTVDLLGRRTAEMHATLGSCAGVPGFDPEPYTPFAQRSIYQSLRNLTHKVFALLRGRAAALPEPACSEALAALAVRDEILRRFRSLVGARLSSLRIRCHGDYHLGQVLFTGKDFIIIDFEGEPARSLGERRFKRSPLRDVAGMLRSYHYAAHAGLREKVARPEDRARLEPWARFWPSWAGRCFLKSYLAGFEGAPAFRWGPAELKLLLELNLLEKAIYEIGYELNNRPDWVSTPLRGLLDLVAPAGPGAATAAGS